MHKRWLALSLAALALGVSGAARGEGIGHAQPSGPVELSDGDLDRVTAGQENWGQEVKACNLSDCYPGGTNRGAYVSDQARDAQVPGYGYEIHTLANPGASDPSLGGF